MSKRSKARAASRAQKDFNSSSQRIYVKPKTNNQMLYIASMSENDITICAGPAGSGKSSVAVGIACDWIEQGKINKIVVTRPTIEVGSTLGLLPGSLGEKIGPYITPILEEFHKYIGKDMTNRYMTSGQLEICPLQLMRGRNFHNVFMILDESQNATMEQLKMFVTRMGIGSKAVIEGDPDQTDLPKHLQGGLDILMDRLYNLPGVGVCKLEACDIVRNPIIARVLERLR